MSDPESSGSEAFQWLDAHMVYSLRAPDEAFDQVFMLRDHDWTLLDKVWAERSPAWREACAYVFVDGPVAKSQQLLRRALQDPELCVATQAAISLCHQMLEYPGEAPFDQSLLPRLRELREIFEGDMAEVDAILERSTS